MNEEFTLDEQDRALAAQIVQSARTVMPSAAFTADLDERLESRMNKRQSRFQGLRFLGTTAAALLLVALVVFSVPSLRAWAQEVVDLITQAISDQVEQELAFSQPADVQTFASVELAEAALGRDFVVPSSLPSGVISSHEQTAEISEITYIPQYANLLIEYQRPNYFGWWLDYSQIPIEVYEQSEQPIMVGQSADIHAVAFEFKGAQVDGRIVRGAWNAANAYELPQAEIDQLAPGETLPLETVWDNDAPILRLMWQSQDMVYTLVTNIESVMEIDADDLIRIAESIE